MERGTPVQVKNSKMRGIVVRQKGGRGQTDKGKDRERDIRARQGS